MPRPDGLITVGELFELLAAYPRDAVVMVPGQGMKEGGPEPISNVSIKTVVQGAESKLWTATDNIALSELDKYAAPILAVVLE